ncbi:MAG: regulatory protein RecX [Pseudomonadota bacterium]
MRLLTAREHSRKQLRGKLSSRGYGSEEIEQVLDDLARRDLQSDDRFAQIYTEFRVGKGNGPIRIRAELRERGISDGLIATMLENYTEDWPDELRRVHDRKYGAELPSDRKEMARRARFLEYRGFPGELIGQLLFNHDF